MNNTILVLLVGSITTFLINISCWQSNQDSDKKGLNTVSVEENNSFYSEFTGKVVFLADWSEPSNGLRCRLGVSEYDLKHYRHSPILVVEVENNTGEEIELRRLMGRTHLVFIKPRKTYCTSSDFQWLFDVEKMRKPIMSGERVRACCRIPAQFLPVRDEYTLSVWIHRDGPDRHPTDAPYDGGWYGSMKTNPIKYKAGYR